MNIVKIQRFSTHDGDGVRTVVFAKGCPLHCAWCHNPETQSAQPQILYHAKQCLGCGACIALCKAHAHHIDADGRHRFEPRLCVGCHACAHACPTGAVEAVGSERSVESSLAEVLRDRAFFGATGGITLSGGEPMAQPRDCIALLRMAKAAGITTALETCGYFDERYISELVTVTDTFLYDVKDSNSPRHRQYTGVGNEKILHNLAELDRHGGRTRLRCILVRGLNMEETHYDGIAAIFHSLKHCEGVELLPYHAFAGSKAEQLWGKDNGNRAWVPSTEELQAAAVALEQRKVPLIRP